MPRVLLVCLIWLCLAPSVTGCSREALPAGTVATVNGQPISLRLLNAAQDLSYLQHAGISERSVDALRKQYGTALVSLIVHSLVVQELRKIGLEVPPEQMLAEEERIRADYPAGEFELALLEMQMDLQTWRELLHNQLALTLFAEKVLSREIELSLEEVVAYYTQHEKKFSYPATMYLRIISGAEQEQVENARTALLGDSDAFLPPEVLEQKMTMTTNSVPEEWRRDIAALKPGEISPVRQGPFQYQAVQLLEEMPAHRMSAVEAYPLVEQALIEEKIHERYAQWMEQAVQKAKIRVSVHLREPPASTSPGEK